MSNDYWNTMDANRVPWLYGVVWLDSFDYSEVHDIQFNFVEFYDILQDVESQIFSMQIGID